jgi:acyl-CoA dehydrogenase
MSDIATDTTAEDVDASLRYWSPFSEEEEAYRVAVRSFLKRDIEPCYNDIGTDSQSRHALWKKAAAAGILGVQLPEEHGGSGGSGLLGVVLSYELARSESYATLGSSFTTDLATGILVAGGSQALISTWAGPILAGDAIQCTAISEPDAGSDVLALRTTAVRDGDDYILNGSKTFITNGDIADIMYVVAKTDKSAGSKGLSLFLVDAHSAGVGRRKLATMGFPGGNTAELHFDNVRVPRGNLLGKEGQGMGLLMTTLGQDRVQVSARALGQAELALDLTLSYVKQRSVFGSMLSEYQNTQFEIATMKTDIEVGRAYLHEQIRKVRGGISTGVETSICKLFLCEMSSRVIDGCLQFFGGMGFMDETPISRIYTANRVLRIYAGSSEIMRRSIARSL